MPVDKAVYKYCNPSN